MGFASVFITFGLILRRIETIIVQVNWWIERTKIHWYSYMMPCNAWVNIAFWNNLQQRECHTLFHNAGDGNVIRQSVLNDTSRLLQQISISSHIRRYKAVYSYPDASTIWIKFAKLQQQPTDWNFLNASHAAHYSLPMQIIFFFYQIFWPKMDDMNMEFVTIAYRLGIDKNHRISLKKKNRWNFDAK